MGPWQRQLPAPVNSPPPPFSKLHSVLTQRTFVCVCAVCVCVERVARNSLGPACLTVVFFFLRLSLELSANQPTIGILKAVIVKGKSTLSLTHTHTLKPIEMCSPRDKVAGVTATVTEVKPSSPWNRSLFDTYQVECGSLWHHHWWSIFYYQQILLIKTRITENFLDLFQCKYAKGKISPTLWYIKFKFSTEFFCFMATTHLFII